MALVLSLSEQTVLGLVTVSMRVKNCKSIFLETTDFDTAVSLTEYGRFHYETIIVCAICIITVGFQNGVSSYVFPAAQCELNLSSFELGLLNISFLVGGILSCFLWGILADINGRRKILAATHLLNACVTFLCVFSPHTVSLIVCRFCNGFLIGAPGSIIFSYFSEFQPPKYRLASVCYCGLFFTLSWLLLPVFACLILPLDIDYELGGFLVLTPWRFFLIIMVLPEIAVGVWFIRMPESPKFYVARGEPRKALTVLRKMYSMNTGANPDLFPVKNLVVDKVKMETHVDEDIGCRNKTVRMLKWMLGESKNLFKPPLITVTGLTCSVMFSNMFGVFGLGLWLPELFIRFEQYHDLHPNETVTVKELASLNHVKNLTCDSSLDPSVIHSTVAMAISSMAFNAIAGWLSTRIPIKIISMVSMLLGGLSAGCIYWLRSSLQNLVVACIFQATMVTANMTIGSIGVELFPTQVGGIALCLIMCAGRIGAVCSNIIFGYLMDNHCEIPIFVVAAVVLLGAGLCYIIPHKNNFEDAEKKFSIGKKEIDIAVIS